MLMNENYDIDVAEFLKRFSTLRRLKPSRNPVPVEGVRNFPSIRTIANAINSDIPTSDSDWWTARVKRHGTPYLYQSFDECAKPMLEVSYSLCHLHSVRRNIADLERGDALTLNMNFPQATTFVYYMRESMDSGAIAVLGLANVLVIELPQLAHWRDSNITWVWPEYFVEWQDIPVTLLPPRTTRRHQQGIQK